MLLAVFCKCAKRRKKQNKKAKQMSDFLKAHISGMAGMIYFSTGMCSLLICRYMQSEFSHAQARDLGATNGHKIILCSLR